MNVLRGGSLVQDLPVHHRHLRHRVEFERDAARFGLEDSSIEASCYHHQALDRIGDGIEIVARANDGVVEAAIINATGWAVGVQWHPEDTAAVDSRQAAIFAELVKQAGDYLQVAVVSRTRTISFRR